MMLSPANSLRWFFFAGVVAIAYCCGVDEAQQDHTGKHGHIRVDLSDENVRLILDQQDHLQVDSLIQWFQHANPTYRYLSARAFSSVIAPEVVSQLQPLLQDPHDSIRVAAAHALGQSGNQNAIQPLISAFLDYDSLSPNSPVNEAILEATGRVGSRTHLDQISSITTYRPDEHHLILGQVMGIYRYMIRGIHSDQSVQRMLEIATGRAYPLKARILATNYLARVNAEIPPSEELAAIATQDPEPYIRMNIILALAKSQHDNALSITKRIASDDADYRVRINAVRALGQFPVASIHQTLLQKIRDENLQVAIAASEVLLEKSSSRYWRTYMDLILKKTPWPVKYNLHATASKNIPPGNAMFRTINEDPVLKRIRSGGDPYQTAAAIKALQYNPARARLLMELAQNARTPIVRTTSASAVLHILQSPAYERLGSNMQSDIWTFMKALLHTGDAALVSIGAQAFRIPDRAPKIQVDTSTFFAEVKSQLQLPRDIEAWQSVEATEAYLEGREAHLHPWTYTHPIEWSLLMDEKILAQIKTNKGTIQVQLQPHIAPATVANFLDLAKLQYYTGKSIHRVVPNFVIQGGCNRGDGYGSLDYNIRTETPPIYFHDEGYIGMASAGRHTESQQWFITHSPTPHLDGRYTIFGKVTSGMDVVHNTAVGDIIEEVKLIGN